MMPSESPTHPDAPRAGGETPAIDPKRIAADAVHRLADSEPDEDAIAAMDHLAGTPQESMFCVSAPVLERMIETTIADALFDASWPSLLERHRDGERAEPDAWLVVIHVRRGGSNTTARYFYSERETAEREADRKCNAIGDSFAQIFPLFAASSDADVSAPPSPERVPHD